MTLRIVESETNVNPAQHVADFVLESEDPQEFLTPAAAQMVINAAAIQGLPNAGINNRGPSAYPVDADGQPITRLDVQTKPLWRMDFKLRASR